MPTLANTEALLEPVPDWEEHEKPRIPGSAAILSHPPSVRVAYAAVAILVGVTGGLGTALVSANLPAIQGDLGLTPTEAAWLPAVYLMVNVSTNLLLFKFRQQFGLRSFAEIGLGAHAALTLLHLFANDFALALIVRAASGLAAATLTSLATMYMLQAFGRLHVPQAFTVGLGLSQVATPLAWILSPGLTDLGSWHALYAFESGLALCSLAAVVLLKLPRGVRIRVFERLDFVTFALLAPALALLVAVLAQGRLQLWTQEWIPGALIAAVLLGAVAFAIEHHRSNPLLQVRWLRTAPMLRFALGAAALRFLLAEQTYGATALLRTLGMGPDQLQALNGLILLGLLAGVALSALSFRPALVIPQILLAIVLIAIGSYLDRNVTNLTRPQDLYASQAMLAMAGGLFLGPLLMLGLQRALERGPSYVLSLIVIFGISQSVGGLLGPAILGTVQQYREHEYSALVNSEIDPTRPQVAQRLLLQSQAIAPLQGDPQLRSAQAAGQLALAATREANVRAYHDIFLLNALLALLFLAWALSVAVRLAKAQRVAR